MAPPPASQMPADRLKQSPESAEALPAVRAANTECIWLAWAPPQRGHSTWLSLRLKRRYSNTVSQSEQRYSKIGMIATACYCNTVDQPPALQFQWLQTAIALRRSDTVDVKFLVDGRGVVVALDHGALERACRRLRKPLTDRLCVQVAEACLRHSLQTGSDLGLELVTPEAALVEELVEGTPTEAGA